MSMNPLFRAQLLRFLSSSSSSSSSILHGCICNLQTLLKSGFTPTIEHLNTHLLFLSESQRFNSVIRFFPQLESNSIKPDSDSHSLLAWALLKLRRYDEAEHLMRAQLGKPSSSAGCFMWDSLIQGYCVHQRDPEKGFSVLLDCLLKDGILPSSNTFCSLIHSFSSLGMMDRAIEVLELMSDEKVNYPFGNFVCSSVISGFCKIGKPEIGVEFFFKARNSGAFRPSLVTYTALVDALCRSGRVDEVGNLFSEIEKEGLGFDVVFFSCWICGFVREGDVVEVFRKNKQMSEKRIAGDVISYTILMDGFSKEWSVEKAGGILAKMRKEGIEPNLITYSVVISGFCRKGKMEEALTMFRMIKDMGIELDEFVYATLIHGACGKGDYNLVFNLLEEMEEKGIIPGVVTYNIVINGLCKVGRMSEADEILNGMVGDIVTYTTLLNGYIGQESVEGILLTKRKFEEADLRLDVVMINVLMKASFLVGTFEDAFALYNGMEDMGIIPNASTYCILIDGFCKAGKIGQALDIFEDFKRTSISSVACYNCIIRGLCKTNMIDVAVDVLSELIQKDMPLDLEVSVLCNEAIRVLCRNGFPGLACDISMMMRRRNLEVASTSYYLMLKGLITRRDQQAYVHPLLGIFVREYGIADPRVMKILAFFSCMADTETVLKFVGIVKKKVPKLTLPFAVLEKLIGDGRTVDAYKLVVDANEDCLFNMDVVDYTTIIDGLCKGGYLQEALNLSNFARKKGIVLNIVAYNTIIKGLCRQGRLVEAFRLYDSLERIGLVPSEITYATLIDILCRERLMLEADKLFKAMVLNGQKPGTHIYNSFIDGYCKMGQLEKAVKMLRELELKGLEVDGFTISALINGYCLKGDMEGALRFFSDFKDRGVFPDFLGFLYLVRGLSTKGRIDEARSVLREMLHSEPVIELINKVENSDFGDDSVYNFLMGLCEQGSIKEATLVLDEIASMYFPASSFHGDNYQSHEHNESHVVDIGTAKQAENAKNDRKLEFQFLCDFDSFYNQVASLCSRGEFQRANVLLKSLIS